MLMNESPVGTFKIRYAMNSKPNGFIIADNSGRFMVFELTNDQKHPYHAIKNMVSVCL